MKITASTKSITSEEFEVILSINKPKNRAPIFVGDIPKKIEINIREPKNISLPSFVDFEGDKVNFIVIGIDEKMYKIEDEKLKLLGLKSKDIGNKILIF